MLKKVILFNSIFSFLAYPTFGQIAVGDSAIEFSLPDTAGNIVGLQDFNGDIILLNFFTSWCVPCQIEAPQLEDSIWQAYKDKGVTIVGLNFQEPLFPLVSFILHYDLTYPIVRDTAGDVFYDYGMFVFPSNVIIDQNGFVAWVEPGFDIPKMKQVIDSLLIPVNTPELDIPPKIVAQNLEIIATYPNPFNNSTKIKFKLKKSANTHLKVYDIIGRLVSQKSYYFKAGNNEIPVELSEQASGIYVFLLSTGKITKSGKLILEK